MHFLLVLKAQQMNQNKGYHLGYHATSNDTLNLVIIGIKSGLD